MLIVFGLIGMLVEIAALGLSFSNPTAIADFYRDMIEKQPAGPQKDDLQKRFKESEASMRLDNPMNIGGCVVGLLLNLLMVIGGLKMKSLSGYGLAMTGSIVAIIPCGGCACFAIPIGIWALVVLLNSDVKRAFGRNSFADRPDDLDPQFDR
jgi:hypothetical protein